MIRRPNAEFLETLSYLDSSDLRADLRRYRDTFRRTLLDAYLRRVILYPDVIPCLTTLRSDGFRLGLLSNTPSFICDSVLDRFELRGLFDHVSSTWTLKSFKPDSQIFLHMTEELGVQTEKTLFVGDSLDCDVKGARNVGALSAYLIREHNSPKNEEALTPRPDVILRNLEELHPIVEKVTLRTMLRDLLEPLRAKLQKPK